MKHLLIAVSILVAAASLTFAEDPAPDLLLKENLGGIKIGLSEKGLSAILGKSVVTKGKLELEGATGDYIQTLDCPEKGLSVKLSAGENKKGAKTVAAFTATAKCTLATAKGIKIGSKMADVVEAYGAVRDKENADAARPDTFVAGSIFGGIIFTFKDGKVSEIFFGAAAE
ncbi:MAG: hypothetical protein JNG86_02755 [Verrucomicrobiaceae bacterium]|nr:hypothetical protein [Verrucomicrobiaceae bacterium]